MLPSREKIIHKFYTSREIFMKISFMRYFILFFLITGVVFLIGCDQSPPKNKIISEYTERLVYTEHVGVEFVNKRMETGEDRFFYSIQKFVFFDPSEPEELKAEFKQMGIVKGTVPFSGNIISPDRKWIVLKTGDSEGFVFCKTEDVLKCVRENKFAGRFNVELYYEKDTSEDMPGMLLVVDEIGWEAPATFVFGDRNRETGEINPLKDIYKINLNTGEFIYPPRPNPVVRPVLYREEE